MFGIDPHAWNYVLYLITGVTILIFAFAIVLILKRTYLSDDKEGPAYYTIDTGNLAPYPNMTQDDLDDFESWVREQDAKSDDQALGCAIVVGIIFVVLIVIYHKIWG